MKHLYVIGILLFLISQVAGAQLTSGASVTIFIEPYPLLITESKTTNLIFPAAIKSVDRGSADILVQKAKGIEHMLLLKARRSGFGETNLSVVTEDGKLYSFLLNYSDNPPQLNVVFKSDVNSSTTTHGSVEKNISISAIAESIAGRQEIQYGGRVRKMGMELRLNGLFIEEDILYFRLAIQNRSNVRFDTDLLSFFIRDRKKVKREVAQELALRPLYIYGDTMVIQGRSTNTVVVAFSKFTLPERKYLSIQLSESSGGRHMHLKVPGRAVLGAQLIH